MTPIEVPDHIREAAERVGSTLPRKLIEQGLAMYAAGWPPAHVARELCIGVTTLHGWRRAAGLPRNGTHNAHRNLNAREAMRTVELYESGLTLDEVGERLGIAPTTVIHRLRSVGVKTRPRGGCPEYAIPKAPDGWVTLSQAAGELGASRDYVRTLAKRGRLAGAQRMAWRSGPGVWIIPRSTLEQMRAAYRPRRRRLHAEPEQPPATVHDLPAAGGRAPMPTEPLALWLDEQVEAGESLEMLAERSGVPTRRLNGIQRREYATVELRTADRLLTRNGSTVALVYGDTESVPCAA